VVFLEGGYVIDSNPAFSSMFGYKSAEIVGRNFVDFIAPQFQAQLLSFSQTNYDKPYQISGVKKDGTVFPLQIQGKETHYQDRLIRVKVVHDLTLQCNSCPVYNHVPTRHHKEDNLLLPEK
jgi:PAS domain S-box-containing protein